MKNQKVTPANHDSIYIRKIYKYKLTRFCVDDTGQKTYWDLDRLLPYSSGQQQKHSLIEEVLKLSGEENAPSELLYEYDQSKASKINHKVYRISTDLRHLESYLRGYMYNTSSLANKDNDNLGKGKKGKKNVDADVDVDGEGEEESANAKNSIFSKNSPFKISCLSPVHKYLVNTINEKHVVVDRRGKQNCDVSIYKKGVKMEDEQIAKALDSGNFNGPMHFVPNKNNSGMLTTGFFHVDIEIDLNKLFRTRISKYERTLQDEVKNELLNDGWYITTEKNIEYLNPPQEFKEYMMKYLPEAIVNFTSQTNQSRNYSIPELVAVAVTNNASDIPRMHRVDINENDKYSLCLNANERAISNQTTLFIDTIVAKNNGVVIDGDNFEDLYPTQNAIDTIRMYLTSKYM